MYTLKNCDLEDINFTFLVKKLSTKNLIDEIWGWNEDFQIGYHNKNFSPQKTKIIYIENVKIGFIVIEKCQDRALIENIMLLPEYQNRGIGTKIILDLIENTEAKVKHVELQVLKKNVNAKRLYKKIGFVPYAETETHFKMKFDIN